MLLLVQRCVLRRLGRGADVNAGLEELQRRVIELESQLQEARALPPRVDDVERRLEAMERALIEVHHRALALADEVSRLKGTEVERAGTPEGNVFAYNPLRPLNGIIAHLTRVCGGNVHKNGVVTVTESVCRVMVVSLKT